MSLPTLRRILGLTQFSELKSALYQQNSQKLDLTTSTYTAALAVLIASLPLLTFYVTPLEKVFDINTFIVGVSAALAIVYRSRHKLPFFSVGSWRQALKLTHYGFALGCIPALFVMAFFPELFRQITFVQSGPNPTVGAPSNSSPAIFIITVATWAAVTEEFIYRGLLVSILRRWRILNSQSQRDYLAIAISAFLFGLAHLPSWGPALSFALMGLGLGFGVAYIAVGELLLPLIVYHFAFDVLSIYIAFFVPRAS